MAQVAVDVAIVGAGPAGLATAATLKPLGLDVRVFEQRQAIGDRWRMHYDRLHLHTTRRMSALPGLAIPAGQSRWVSRDDFVRYQEAYARHHALDVTLGTKIERIDRRADGWELATGSGVVRARFVVVSAGYHTAPYLPPWPGRDRFTGELSHALTFRNGAPYRGKRVVVVGTGNTGAEIATDLVEHGAEVWWSVRTPPTILPRAVLGIATQVVGVVMEPLPPWMVDPVVGIMSRLTIGNLGAFGLARPPQGAYSRALRDHVLPILDAGIVALLKARRVQPVAAVDDLDGAGVVLADGRRLAADAVIACTGYRPALESMIGHLGVLDDRGAPRVFGPRAHPNAPDMFFLGYTPGVAGGLREIALHARQIARAIGRVTRGA